MRRIQPLQVPAPCGRKNCGEMARWAYVTNAGKLKTACDKHRPKEDN